MNMLPSTVRLTPTPPDSLAEFCHLDTCEPIDWSLQALVFELAIRGHDTKAIVVSPYEFLRLWWRSTAAKAPFAIRQIESSEPRRFALDLPTPIGVIPVICDSTLTRPEQ